MMVRNSLPGGAVRDPASDQNFRSLDQSGKALDRRLSDIEEEGAPPSGAAGGVLKGKYPDPEFAVDMATQAELEAGLSGKQDAASAATDAELAAETEAREAADAALIGTSIVPFRITAGQSFTVPTNKQALWTVPIEVEGTLEVEGMLVEVS